MAKISFDIKFRPQIESGEYKVITGDNRPVRIISWDKKVFGGRFEIVALVPTSQGDTETVQLYCPDGTLLTSNWNEKFKLFIITPEPELTEFEKAVKDLCWKIGIGEVVYKDDIIKKTAAELLDLARKELEPEMSQKLDYAHQQFMTAFIQGKRFGKEKILKDLPRWKVLILKQATPFLGCRNEDELFYKGRVIALSELEKLPGFKED